MIEYKLLVKNTVEVLKELNIDNPMGDTSAIRSEKSVWSLIVHKSKGSYNQSESLAIRTKWICNGKNCRELVLAKLKDTSINSSDDSSSSSLLLSANIQSVSHTREIDFNKEEIIYIQSQISGKLGSRKKLNSNFDRILTFKLQQQQVNCSLKCCNNWFSKQNKVKEIWSGRY
jgi:hypothetical protein